MKRPMKLLLCMCVGCWSRVVKHQCHTKVTKFKLPFLFYIFLVLRHFSNCIKKKTHKKNIKHLKIPPVLCLHLQKSQILYILKSCSLTITIIVFGKTGNRMKNLQMKLNDFFNSVVCCGIHEELTDEA